MKQDEFANVVIDSKILTHEEVIAFFKYYSSTLNSPMEFSESARSGYNAIDHRGRFLLLSIGWGYGSGRADGINFTVDKDIILHGLRLFGREDGDYSVTLTMKKEGGSALLCGKRGTFLSKLLDYKIGKYYGFEVLFYPAVQLNKDVRYQIEALISGPRSLCGSNGVSSVVCSGVTFTFTNNGIGGNGTNTNNGQFPEILFSVLT